jgi:hypothetical protein
MKTSIFDMIVIEEYEIFTKVRLELTEHSVLVNAFSRAQIRLGRVKFHD